MSSLIIADDNLPFVKNLYNKLISQMIDSSKVFLSSSGKETIKYLQEYHPNILLLDLKMPEGNGIEVIKYIIHHNLETKIIIISSHIEELYKNKVLINRISAIFQKPINIEDLLKSINDLLQESGHSEIKNFVINELEQFNFNFKSKGYFCLVTAATIVLSNHSLKFNLEKQVYKEVAIYHKVSNSYTIKWCIDKSISKMSSDENLEFIKNFFHLDDNQKPTAKVIITTLYDIYVNQKQTSNFLIENIKK